MSEAFIGEIRMFGFNWPPRYWGLCQGEMIAITSNTALFSLLGTTWGGDGRNTFGLPNLSGRLPIGQGNGPGLTYRALGQYGGMERYTLSYRELPSHSHQAAFIPDGNSGGPVVRVSTSAGTSATPQNGDYLAGGDYDGDPTKNFVPASSAGTTVELGGVSGSSGSGGTVTVSPAGNSDPIPVMNPYLVMNFSIALMGIFPSRN